MFFALKIFLFSAIFTSFVQTKIRPELVDDANKFINILHFNDAYNVYWAPQFAHKFMSLSDAKTIRAFSGDIYSPSSESRYLRGAQFEEFFKAIKLNVAVPGNHEFDMTVEHFLKLQKVDQLPWLLPNFVKIAGVVNEHSPFTAELLKSLPTLRTIKINGFNVGFFGLFDKPSYLASRLTRTDITHTDPLQTAREMSKLLRKQGCDLVIVLSHMNNETDEEILKDSNNDVDIVLGGHIHQFRVNVINNRLLLKSGHDFFDFSKSKLYFSKQQVAAPTTTENTYEYVFTDKTDESKAPSTWQFSLKKSDNVYLNVEIARHKVAEDGPVNAAVHEHLMKVVDPVMKKLSQDIAFSVNMPQNIKDNSDRKRVFPLYNFLIDMVRAEFGNDISILNTGAFRLKKNIEQGEKLSALDLDGFFPFDDDLNSLLVPGQKIPALLNEILNFGTESAAMAGITFKYKNLNGQKSVVEGSVKINGEPLDNYRNYLLVTSSYFGTGQIAPTLSAKEIQDTKRVLKGFNEQGVIMKYMRELTKPENTQEYMCFKSRLPDIKSDDLIKYYKKEVKEDKKQTSFCKAAEKSPNSIGESAKKLLETVSQSVLQRLMIYSMMGSVKKVGGQTTKTWFEANLDNKEVATLEDLII